MPTSQSIANVKKCLLAGAVLAAALSPCIADAGLGQAETSVQTDAVQLKGSIKAMVRGSVTHAWARHHHPRWHREVTGGGPVDDLPHRERPL